MKTLFDDPRPSRAEIIRAHPVRYGLIWRPGKYWGQRLYIPYFVEGSGASEFQVSDKDREEFPELEGKDVVRIARGSHGEIMEV